MPMNVKHTLTRKIIAAVLLIVLTAAVTMPSVAHAEKGNAYQKTIRMGYFNLEDYMIGAEDNAAKSGFAYDLMCEIASINGWKYEFVYGDFSNLYNQLLRGEIDVLPCVVYTEDRAKVLKFSKSQISEERYFVSALNEDTHKTTEISDLDGKRISTVKDAYQNTIFEDWAKRNGISMEMVYADYFDESWEILKEGKADYILNIDNSAPDSGYTTLYEIGSCTSHFAVPPNKKGLLKEINSAIDTIYEINPFSISHLQEKYLTGTLSSYKLSEDEQKWLNKRNVIKVAGLKNEMPYTYADKNGKAAGVYPDTLKTMFDELGIDINVKWTLYDSLDEMHSALYSGKADLICPDYHSHYYAQSNNIIISENIQDVIMGLLYSKKDNKKDLRSIAALSSGLGIHYIAENYPDAEIIKCSTVDDCIDAVSDGEADAAIAHVSVLEKGAKNRIKNYRTKPLIVGCPVCFSAKPEDKKLMNIINRGLHLISKSELQSLEMKHSEDDYSIWAIAKKNKPIVFLLLVALLLIIAFGFERYIHSKKLKKNLDEMTKQSEIIEKNAEQLSNYKKALLAGALISLEVNLSRDELYYGVWVNEKGDVIPLKDIIGIDVPCSYDEYIKRWSERFVAGKSKEGFSTDTGRNYLINSFNNGISEITFDYEADTIDGNHAYLRRDIFMHRSSEGEIIAYTTVKDISEIGSAREKEEVFINALSTEYDCVDIFYYEGSNFSDARSAHHRISHRFENMMPEKWRLERNFEKRLEYMCECVVPEDKEMFRQQTRPEAFMESFKNENPIHVVDFRLSENDDIVYYQERFIPINDFKGRYQGIAACIRCTDAEIKRELGYRSDIEQAKMLAETANSAKTTFLFNMSHDIRTPMNAILGFARLAKNHINDESLVTDYLNKLEISADQLLALINDVLEMSRIEAGKLDITELPEDISAILDDINPMLESLAISKSIEYTSAIKNVTDRFVLMDKTHCNRVLVNIITNAIKYTPDGGKVNVQLEQISLPTDGKADYRFTVSDTGIGMSEDFIEHMFEEFSREKTSTASKVQGTGLGLAIVKRITDAMGGTINVESKLKKGSVFTLTVSLRVQTEDEITQFIGVNELSSEKSACADIRLDDKKVLLVEDNELNREIAEEMLTEEGLIVETAEDGKIAVDMVKAKGIDYYDVIVMDIQMPVMNGYEATKAIRELQKPEEHVLIIAASANAFEEDVKRSLDAGMDDHIAKPIKCELLIEKLKEHIDASK